MEPESVKVVVTTYNRRDWAEAAIESVLQQTYQPISLVIVDDASSDGTAELVESYRASDPERITAVQKDQNRGVADSIRRGLTAGPPATYVAFLNDDDLWRPTMLERGLEVFRRNSDLGLVFCDAERLDDYARSTGELFSEHFGRFTSGDFSDALRANHACGSALLITAELADIAARSFPTTSHVWDYYIVLLAAGYAEIGMVDEPLVLWRVTDSGLSSQEARMLRDTTRVRQEVFDRNPKLIDRVGGPREARRQLALRALEAAIWRLEEGDWREYRWHVRQLLRERSVRPAIWLTIHTTTTLYRRYRVARRSTGDAGGRAGNG